jgi:hypothetical protein
MSKVQTMPLEIWTDINGNAARTQFKGGTKYIRADAQATVEALWATIKQMGEQACVLAKDGMAAKAQVEALQRERDEAIEAASLPTWVCDGCGRVSSDGWINHVIESLDGTDYEMECPTCGVRDIEEDCALDLVRERDDLQAALDAEREKVKGLEQEAERLRIVNRGHINEGFKDMKTIEELTAAFAKAQAQLSQLQALVRAYFTEPDPHKWTAAYQTLKRMGRALPATPTESGEDHSGDDTDMVQKGGGDGE